MASPYADLDRPPLAGAALTATLRRGGSRWRVTVLDRSVSTNAELVSAARAGEPEGLVLVAEAQLAGRGRLGRTWASPPRAGLTFSVLLRPVPVPPAGWPLLPLLTGVALSDAVTERSGLAVELKWPNDLLAADGRKLAGVLVERVDTRAGPAAVVGVGLNVTTRPAELAALPEATSLAQAGAETTDRATLLLAVLRRLEAGYAGWLAAGGEPAAMLPAYRSRCGTIGRRVRLELPGGVSATGTASRVHDDGRLVVRSADGLERAYAVADVAHLRAG